MKINKKEINSILFLFLIISFIALLYSIKPTITGMVTGTMPEYSIGEIPEQVVVVGEEFAIKIIPTKEDGVKRYWDNTGLFNITREGIIIFTPTEKNSGINKVVIIVEYLNGDFEADMIRFNIIER